MEGGKDDKKVKMAVVTAQSEPFPFIHVSNNAHKREVGLLLCGHGVIYFYLHSPLTSRHPTRKN